MADKIRLLPEKVANQIAAGEVVDRPCSIVKEMMENSIDAGATEVVVNSRDGGFELIQICDNGCGMSPNDARMAFDRHATSKISRVEDIYSLRTFGFRGEALASIGAVAKVELRTKQEGSEWGTLTEVQGGDFVSQSTVMCDVGTQFLVKELFYNIPARRKFASKITTSANQIKTEFKRVALCYPHIRFELYGNDAPLYSLAPSTLAGRIVDIAGRSMKQNLLETIADTSIVKIKGYIGRPSTAKKSMADQYLFVNGRYFRSPYFTKAIMKGYEKLIPEGLNPSFFLFLEVEPDNVDVNVHPQKIEVKFADEESIWQIINAAVREALAVSGAVSLMEFDNVMPIEIPAATKGVSYAEPKSNSLEGYNPFKDGYIDTKGCGSIEDFTGFDVPYTEEDSKASMSTTSMSTHNLDIPSNSNVSSVRDVQFNSNDYESFESFKGVEIPRFDSEEIESEGVNSTEFDNSTFEIIESSAQPSQMEFEDIESRTEVYEFKNAVSIGGGYLSAILGRELVIIDGRRAKERVMFDHYISLLNSGSAVSQQLLFPEKLILSISEYDVMEQNSVEFALLGFDIDYCGEGVIEVKGIPADESNDSIDTLIYELIKLCASPIDIEEQRRERLATTMARSASKSMSKYMTQQEAQEIVDRLAMSSNISYSPSGKDIFWKITTEDIKNKLG
ncbi:MAG: DNA mismatch repair endonuclease MutL [Rikenellaceae bacterium]